VDGGLFDIVLDAVEKRALVYHERGQVLKQVRELRDRFGNLIQFRVSAHHVRRERLLERDLALGLAKGEISECAWPLKRWWEAYRCSRDIVIGRGHALWTFERDGARGNHEILVLDRVPLQLWKFAGREAVRFLGSEGEA
jgi:hypothetical protein